MPPRSTPATNRFGQASATGRFYEHARDVSEPRLRFWGLTLDTARRGMSIVTPV